MQSHSISQGRSNQVNSLLRLASAPPPAAIDTQNVIYRQPRNDQDLYSPRWVRGEGYAREGWCCLCGRWLVLKTSAFNYDKIHTHGISPVTRLPFEVPVAYRIGRRDREKSCKGRESTRADSRSFNSPCREPSDENHYSHQYEAQCGKCKAWIAVGTRLAKGLRGSSLGSKWIKHAHKVSNVVPVILNKLCSFA